MNVALPVSFLPKMGVAGNQTIVSPVHDLREYSELVASFACDQLAATANGTLDGYLEHSADRVRWATLLSFSQLHVGVAPCLEIASAVRFARFVRAVVLTASTSNDVTATLSLTGIARGPRS